MGGWAIVVCIGFGIGICGMEIEEVGFMIEVGKNETVDLVETYGKYGDNRSVVMGLYFGS